MWKCDGKVWKWESHGRKWQGMKGNTKVMERNGRGMEGNGKVMEENARGMKGNGKVAGRNGREWKEMAGEWSEMRAAWSEIKSSKSEVTKFGFKQLKVYSSYGTSRFIFRLFLPSFCLPISRDRLYGTSRDNFF